MTTRARSRATTSARAGEPARRVLVNFNDLSPSAQIRSAALRLLAERGSAGASLRAIAAEAGMSLGAVVYHFKSKAALEEAVAADILASIRHAVDGVGAHMPVREALEARRRAWADLEVARPEIRAYLRRALADADESGRAVFRLILEEERAQLTQMMDAGLARHTDDIDATVAVYFAMVSAGMLLGLALADAFGIDVNSRSGIDRLQRAEVDLLTNPLFPTPPTPRRRQGGASAMPDRRR